MNLDTRRVMDAQKSSVKENASYSRGHFLAARLLFKRTSCLFCSPMRHVLLHVAQTIRNSAD